MKSAEIKERVLLLVCGRDTISRCVLRILLGGTLIFASTSKFPMHSEFVNLVNSYHLLPVWMGTAYATALPWVELLVGAYLILGVLVRPSGIVAALISISFVVANLSSIARSEEQCLHCFGEVIALSSLQALIIDIAMVAIAVYVVVVGGRGQILCFDSWFDHRRHSKVATPP